MGLPISSNISVDLVPMFIMNIVMSIVQIKHALQSLIQVLGLPSAIPRSCDATLSLQFPDDYSFCSGLILPGLCEEIQRALPLTVYDPDADTSLRDVECSVCCQEFEKEQQVYRLPLCNHAFHKGCVDQWLYHEQTTCPLCRTSLVPEDVSRRQQQKERELSEELLVWFSSTQGHGFQGLWCYN